MIKIILQESYQCQEIPKNNILKKLLRFKLIYFKAILMLKKNKTNLKCSILKFKIQKVWILIKTKVISFVRSLFYTLYIYTFIPKQIRNILNIMLWIQK